MITVCFPSLLWRSEWAKMCNRHLSIDNQIDHRSYERQGKLKVPTIHEGADARKIEEKYLTGQIRKGSWKVEEDPQALVVATNACLAIERLGMPEARIVLSQAATSDCSN